MYYFIHIVCSFVNSALSTQSSLGVFYSVTSLWCIGAMLENKIHIHQMKDKNIC